jgi:hypothetical protein
MSTWLQIPLHGRASDTSHNKALRRLSARNMEAQHLFRNCDVQVRDPLAPKWDWDHQFGTYELENDIVGPLIIARKDKRPLHLLHAMAVVHYAEHVMTPLLDTYQRDRQMFKQAPTYFEHQAQVMIARHSIVQHAKPENFRLFWYKYKEQKVNGSLDMLVDEGEETAHLQMKMWTMDREELTPRPEWQGVRCPCDVGKHRLSIGKMGSKGLGIGTLFES